MSRFLCKSIVYVGFRCYSLRCLGGQSSKYSVSSCTRMRRFSIAPKGNQKHSFTVSYLTNSLGLSQKEALSVSKRVSFETPEKPDKAVEFFKGHGFTVSQIAALVRNYPVLLLSDTHKTILPKFEFLRAKGLSGPGMASALSSFPSFLKASLANKIVPSYEFLSGAFGSDERVALALKRSPDILVYSLERHLSPNVDALRRHGVPGPKIFELSLRWPRVFGMCPVRFREAARRAAEMGFDASKTSFTQATTAILSGTRNSKWENRVAAYKKWGWTDEEVSNAFRACPRCMLLSVDNISASLEYFVAELGLKPSQIARSPAILSHSLKKARLRFSVHRVLVSKALLNKNVDIFTLVYLSEKDFVKRFVAPYVEEAPELLGLYGEKVSNLERNGERRILVAD